MAVRNSHANKRLPTCTDQSYISSSAEPETRKRDCAAGGLANARGRKEEAMPATRAEEEEEKYAESTLIV